MTWHRTAGGTFSSNSSFLAAEAYEPTLLWDPHTGETGQFLAANTGAYALMHKYGFPETNRLGSIHVQVEMVDYGGSWDLTQSPMVGLDAILDWLRSLGIPDRWPLGDPPSMPDRLRDSAVHTDVWLNESGHYDHAQVPGNDHVDLGHIDMSLFFVHGHHTVVPPPAHHRAPVVAPAVQEDDVKELWRVGTGPKVYLTDGLSRRWVASQADLEQMIKSGFCKAEVREVTQAEMDAVTLTGKG